MSDDKHAPTFPCPTEANLRTAVQALAYLLAFNHVTKQPSAFDDEREAALVTIREHAAFIVRACNAHYQLVAALAEALSSIRAHGCVTNDCEERMREALAKAQP